MLNLFKGIYGKLSGSALASHIGTRMYPGRAPEEAVYPYIVYIVVSDVPNLTFSEDFEDVVIQFSIFSDNASSTEAHNIYADLKTLYDECTMTITSETLVWMIRQNAQLMVEDHTTRDGLIQVWHYAVDYYMMVKV